MCSCVRLWNPGGWGVGSRDGVGVAAGQLRAAFGCAEECPVTGECVRAVYVPLLVRRPPWGVSVCWSARVPSEVVLVARSGGFCFSERVSAVRSGVVSRGVGVQGGWTYYICMFGILYLLVGTVSLVM